MAQRQLFSKSANRSWKLAFTDLKRRSSSWIQQTWFRLVALLLCYRQSTANAVNGPVPAVRVRSRKIISKTAIAYRLAAYRPVARMLAHGGTMTL